MKEQRMPATSKRKSIKIYLIAIRLLIFRPSTTMWNAAEFHKVNKERLRRTYQTKEGLCKGYPGISTI